MEGAICVYFKRMSLIFFITSLTFAPYDFHIINYTTCERVGMPVLLNSLGCEGRVSQADIQPYLGK